MVKGHVSMKINNKEILLGENLIYQTEKSPLNHHLIEIHINQETTSFKSISGPFTTDHKTTLQIISYMFNNLTPLKIVHVV